MRRLLLPLGALLLAAGCGPRGLLGTGPPIRWERLPDLPQALAGQFAGVSNGALVVAGGSRFTAPIYAGGKKEWVDTVYVLDPGGSPAWRLAGKLDGPLAYGAAVTTDDGIICIGGTDPEACTDKVFRLRWVGGKVEQTPLPSLPRPCAYSAAALVGTTVYVAGGQDVPKPSAAMRSFWALDLAEPDPKWKALPPWPGPGRLLATAGSRDGSFFLFGGIELKTDERGTRSRSYLADAYAWSPRGRWTRLADLSGPRAGAPSPAPGVGEASLLLLGGDDGENAHRVWELKEKHPGFSRQALAWDTAKGRWRDFGPLPAGLIMTTAVAWQGGIVVPGGEDRPGSRSAEALLGRVPQ